MKTLHLDLGRDMRGGQWQVLRLIRGLVARGDEPLLLARENGELLRVARSEGLPTQPFRILALPQTARKFDLLHAHDARAHAFAVLFKRTPIVVARRVAFLPKAGFLNRRKYKKADCYIAVSQFVASVLADSGIPEYRIEVVYDGVPLLPVTDRTAKVIAMPLKDQMAGSGLLDTFRISKNFLEDLTTANILIYITNQEGLGSAALLAMSAGVPVIASRIGGLPEIIDHGVDGLLVENTHEAISAAVQQLTANASEYGSRARAKIQARFSETRMVEETVKVYRKLLAHA